MNTSIALYQLADQYLAAAHELTDLDLDEQTVLDTLEGMAGSLEDKAINVAKFIQNLRASSLAMKLAEARMYDRRKAVEKREQRIMDYLKSNMERCGISKIGPTRLARQRPPTGERGRDGHRPQWRTCHPLSLGLPASVPGTCRDTGRAVIRRCPRSRPGLRKDRGRHRTEHPGTSPPENRRQQKAGRPDAAP